MSDAIQQFKQAMYSAGMTPPESIEPDGQIKRFASNDQKNDKNGWYILHGDGIPAGAFGDWSKGFSQNWQANIDRALTPSEIRAHQVTMEAVKKQRESERLAMQKTAKEKANGLWTRALPASNHPYLLAKQIQPYTAKQIEDSLLIPLYDDQGIASLQIIKADGSKRFLTGGKIAGCYYPIGKINNAKALCICEGYATGASIHQATGYPVAIAFNAGNLLEVSKTIRAKYPQLTLIICGDDDYKTEGNPGVTKAAETAQAVNGLLAIPTFGSNRKEKATDFNDMAQEAGLEAVRTVIEGSFMPELGVILLKASELDPKPIDWIWHGWLAGGKLHLLGGVAGTGKTTISLALASAITNGERFPDGTKAPMGNVVIWSGEDDISDTLTPRLMAMGADLEKVHFVHDVKAIDGERPFDPSSDMPKLKEAISRIGNVKLLIIDPIVSISNGDSHKNAEVRKDLAPLVQMAESLRFAIIGITHVSKGTSGREPVERITGSLAFGAVARVVLFASKSQNEDGDDIRIFVRGKSNIGSDEGGFEYSLEQTTTDNGIETSRVVWGTTLEGSARELLGQAEEDSGGVGIKGCMRLITDLLAYGEVSANEMKKDCIGAGYSEATTRRAREKLGVESTKKGMGSKSFWVWELPKMLNLSKDAHPQNLSTLGKNEHLKEEIGIIEGEL